MFHLHTGSHHQILLIKRSVTPHGNNRRLQCRGTLHRLYFTRYTVPDLMWLQHSLSSNENLTIHSSTNQTLGAPVFFVKFCTEPLQRPWHDSVNLISTLLPTYLLSGMPLYTNGQVVQRHTERQAAWRNHMITEKWQRINWPSLWIVDETMWSCSLAVTWPEVSGPAVASSRATSDVHFTSIVVASSPHFCAALTSSPGSVIHRHRWNQCHHQYTSILVIFWSSLKTDLARPGHIKIALRQRMR